MLCMHALQMPDLNDGLGLVGPLKCFAIQPVVDGNVNRSALRVAQHDDQAHARLLH